MKRLFFSDHVRKYASALLLLFPLFANAHWHGGYYNSGANLYVANGSNWMRNLAGEDSVTSLSIPGTHDSVSRHGGPYVETQSLTIPQQLQAGIRFLDIRGRPTNGSLAIHHGAVYQNKMFGEVLNEVITFLQANPSEFILMRIKQEHSNDEAAFLQALNKYVTAPQNKSFIWVRNEDGPFLDRLKVDDVRGKIVLLREAYNSRYLSDLVGAEYGYFINEDSWVVSTNWDLYGHWEKKKSALNAAHTRGRDSLTYLSGADIAFPYFVVSGHSSPGTSAPRLATFYTTPGWSWKWKDFPRVDCLGSLCTIAFEGTNILATELIKTFNIKNTNTSINESGLVDENRPNPRYVGIVATDFPGAGFIETIIAANRLVNPDGCDAAGGCLTMSCDVGAIKFDMSKNGTLIANYSKNEKSGSWTKLGPFVSSTGLMGLIGPKQVYYRNVRAAGVVDFFTWGSEIAFSCPPTNVRDRIDGKIWTYVGTTTDDGNSYFYDRAGYNGNSQVPNLGSISVIGNGGGTSSSKNVGTSTGISTGAGYNQPGVSVGTSKGVSFTAAPR